MSTGLYSHTTRATGTVLTSAIYNSDHQNHITNLNPIMIGGYEDSVGQMQSMSDPGALGSEVLAGNMASELEQIRFAIARIQGTTHWYEAPASDLSGAGGADPLVLAFLAQTPLTLRRTENTTAEVEVESVQSGSGVGNKHSRRIVGSGSNAVSEVREYIGATEIWRTTSALRTLQTAHHFNANWTLGVAGAATITGNIAGYFDFTEIAGPANPAANIARMYCRDIGGLTRMFYRDSTGAEQLLTTDAVIPAFVQGVRLGTAGTTSANGALAAGHVMTGYTPGETDPKAPVAHVINFKPLQQQISGVWATVSG